MFVSARFAPSGATSRSWKAVERDAELLHELERDADAVLGVLDRVGAVFPGPDGAAGAERVAAGAAERVPVDDGEPQVVAHRLAADLFVGVVMAEGERVLRLRAFVLDAFDFGKCGLHGGSPVVNCGLSRIDGGIEQKPRCTMRLDLGPMQSRLDRLVRSVPTIRLTVSEAN